MSTTGRPYPSSRARPPLADATRLVQHTSPFRPPASADPHIAGYMAEAIRLVVAEEVAAALAAVEPVELDGWMDAKQAAGYLGLSLDALHKLTAAGTVPCGADSDLKGAKRFFLRSELDDWRRGNAG